MCWKNIYNRSNFSKRLSNLGEVDKHYYKEHHEPIISKELFDRVQE